MSAYGTISFFGGGGQAGEWLLSSMLSLRVVKRGRDIKRGVIVAWRVGAGEIALRLLLKGDKLYFAALEINRLTHRKIARRASKPYICCAINQLVQ